jgi:ribosomal protein S18 acetylase RimI-like enzyme
VELRPARANDVATLVHLDPIAQKRTTRVEFIRSSVYSGNCILAVEGTEVVAYAVLDYTFFGQGYISMLYVHPNHRRRSVGTQLMRSLEASCTTEKLFTSTNRSNAPMQALLPKLGFVASGTVENLDEDDPELIYFKRVRPQSA